MRRLNKSALFPALALVFGLLSLFAIMNESAKCQRASADYGQFPVDFCYQVEIAITNTGGSDLTNVAARVPVNALGLITTTQIDPRIWDLYSYVGSFAQETDILAQSLTLSTAPWWIHVPDLPMGETRIITLTFGADDVQRDQGVLFEGNDEVATPHTAAFSVADDLNLYVDLEMLDATAQTATLAQHWAGGQGYRLRLFDNASALEIRGGIEASECAVAWDPLWTNTNIRITMTYLAPTLTIYVDGVSENACNTGLGAITAVAQPLNVGTDLVNGIIREVRMIGASTLITHYGYDPVNIAETVAVNPFQGTVADLSGNGYTATYTFDRSQADFTTAVGPVTLVSAPVPPPPATAVPDIVGSDNIFGISSTPGPEASGSIFGLIFGPAAASWVGPRGVFWTTIFLGYAAVVGLGTFILWRGYMPIVVTLAGIPVLVGWKSGYLDWWVLVFWVFFVILAWWATRHGEGGS